MWVSLVSQWWKNPPANAGDMGSIPDLGGSHILRSNEARAPQPEKALAQQRKLSAMKNKWIKNLKK